MKIATLLFTYHRSYHTEQVICSLKKNTVLPQKLMIFQDGLKRGEDVYEWEKVSKLIHSIDWCNKEIIVSEYNQGLDASILAGIDYAFQEYDAVIVLEDDCVTAPNFMRFMTQCLEKYRNEDKVHSVSGYIWPLGFAGEDADILFCGRFSSWGWGTWKNRWDSYEKDYTVLREIKHSPELSRELALWGMDLEQMLIRNARGEDDVWDVHWALNAIHSGRICINPYQSLIQNIGCDGTGIHSGQTDRFQVVISEAVKEKFELPDEVTVLENTKEVFTKLYGSYTAIEKDAGLKENILIYGLGKFFFQNEKEINEKYHIKAFIDKKQKGWFAGRKIIQTNEIEQYEYDKIIIMVWNIKECLNIAKELASWGISCEKLVLGHNLYGNYRKYIEKITVLPDGNLSVSIGGFSVKVYSKEEFHNVYEVLVNQMYHYFLNNGKRNIVFDIGINIGETVLYFLNFEKVEKIYAYEPFHEIYPVAVDNLQKYLHNTQKIEILQYGIEGKAYEKYQTAEQLMPIMQKHCDCNMILKVNCESEEYDIIEELSEKGILHKFSIIMVVEHDNRKDSILHCLKDAGFSYRYNMIREDVSFIYANHTV